MMLSDVVGSAMLRFQIRAGLAAVFLFVALPVGAQSFPDGGGRTILETQCSACHTPDIVRTSRRSADEWRDVVLAMNDLGAKVTEEQFPVLIDYLAKNFSQTRPSTPDPSSSPEPRSAPAPGRTPTGPPATARNASPASPTRDDPADVAKLLGDAKVSFLDGILQAERGNGPAISAKFEVDEGKLVLSVYNAKKGMGLSAEYNVLTELKGDATTTKWQPTLEVFEDKAHISRAATQLTVMQLSKVFLSDLIEKAKALQSGAIYSAIPDVKGGKAVVEFLFASPSGPSVAVTLDAETGEKIR
jgi:hypothetical protein